MTEALPQNWEKWSLAEVGEWFGGGTPSSTNAEFWNGHILWVSPKDMKTNEITTSQDRITQSALDNSAAKLIPAHSVLFVTRSGILAHSFPVATNKVAVTVNQDLKAITPVEAIEPHYLTWLLRFSERQILGTCSKNGTTVHSIEIPALKRLEMPIPPHNEQRRIVAKIEELFSELDKGVEALTTAREQLNVYRQSVLKHAFEGKLTNEWRRTNIKTPESEASLLARLAAERKAHHLRLMSVWSGEQEEWNKRGSLGPKPSRIRSLEPISPLSKEVMESLPELPFGWAWQKLAWMTCGVEYGTAAKSSESGSVPVVRMGNLQNGLIDWTDLVFTSEKEEIEQYSLECGDVLFNRTNSPELVGKTAIYRGERPAIFAGYLIRVNHNPSTVDGRYLNYFLNSHFARQYGNTVKTDGVNQSNINGQKLQGFPFPFCSLAEQQEAVRLIEEKLSSCEYLLSEIEDQRARARALRQSVLQQAFSGHLAAQDPTDEPASVLHSRIHAERKNTATKRQGRKIKKKKNEKEDAA